MKFEKNRELVSLTRGERRAADDRDYLMRAAQGHFKLAKNDEEKKIAARAYVLADIGPDRRPLRPIPYEINRDASAPLPQGHQNEIGGYSGKVEDSALQLGASTDLANELSAEAYHERQYFHDAAFENRNNPQLADPNDLLKEQPTYLAAQVVALAAQRQFPEITQELAKLAEPQPRPSVTEQIKTATRAEVEKDRELNSIMRELEHDQVKREQTGPTISRGEGRDRW